MNLKIVLDSGRKLSSIWVAKGSEYYNNNDLWLKIMILEFIRYILKEN